MFFDITKLCLLISCVQELFNIPLEERVFIFLFNEVDKSTAVEIIVCKTCVLNMQAGVSGGGSLPMHIDKFFEVETLDYHFFQYLFLFFIFFILFVSRTTV